MLTLSTRLMKFVKKSEPPCQKHASTVTMQYNVKYMYYLIHEIASNQVYSCNNTNESQVHSYSVLTI